MKHRPTVPPLESGNTLISGFALMTIGAGARTLYAMRPWSLCPAVLVACAWAATALAVVVPLGEKANRTTARVHVGDTLVIRLSANASTGYAWTITASGRPVLRVLSARYMPAKSGLVGAPGTFIARVAVRTVGRVTLRLAYRRHTHPRTPPARNFEVKIVARPG